MRKVYLIELFLPYLPKKKKNSKTNFFFIFSFFYLFFVFVLFSTFFYQKKNLLLLNKMFYLPITYYATKCDLSLLPSFTNIMTQNVIYSSNQFWNQICIYLSFPIFFPRK